MSERRCPECNYNDKDAQTHMDHKLCKNYPFFTRHGEYEQSGLVGYWLERHDCSGRVFCGTTPQEVADCVKTELDMHNGLSSEECSEITITAFPTTAAKIAALPDFQGW